jgi:hypothetical protein
MGEASKVRARDYDTGGENRNHGQTYPPAQPCRSDFLNLVGWIGTPFKFVVCGRREGSLGPHVSFSSHNHDFIATIESLFQYFPPQ